MSIIKSSKNFSMIELMTVLSVMLVLFLLSISVMKNMRLSAHNVVCKNNYKNIGALCFIYSNDNDSVLPGWRADDLKMTRPEKKVYYYYVQSLYDGWSGHLVPYAEPTINDYFKSSGMGSDGQVYDPEGEIPKIKTRFGWQIVKDTVDKGGYMNLATFICPSAVHFNDKYVEATYGGVNVPRIAGITSGYKMNHKAHRGHVNKGAPASYMANAKFFSDSIYFDNKTYRMDSIANLDRKILMVEGNFPLDIKYGGGEPIGNNFSISPENTLYLNAHANSISTPSKHIFSFFHDEPSPAWVSTYFGGHKYADAVPLNIVEAFNRRFYPRAYMAISSLGYHQKRIVCKEGPVSGFLSQPEVKQFFKDYNFAIEDKLKGSLRGAELLESKGMYTENTYAYGEMNVLMGDGSVKTKTQYELYNVDANLFFRDDEDFFASELD